MLELYRRKLTKENFVESFQILINENDYIETSAIVKKVGLVKLDPP